MQPCLKRQTNTPFRGVNLHDFSRESANGQGRLKFGRPFDMIPEHCNYSFQAGLYSNKEYLADHKE